MLEASFILPLPQSNLYAPEARRDGADPGAQLEEARDSEVQLALKVVLHVKLDLVLCFPENSYTLKRTHLHCRPQLRHNLVEPLGAVVVWVMHPPWEGH